jgi:hypothetical protein
MARCAPRMLPVAIALPLWLFTLIGIENVARDLRSECNRGHLGPFRR